MKEESGIIEKNEDIDLEQEEKKALEAIETKRNEYKKEIKEKIGSGKMSPEAGACEIELLENNTEKFIKLIKTASTIGLITAICLEFFSFFTMVSTIGLHNPDLTLAQNLSEAGLLIGISSAVAYGLAKGKEIYRAL
jgi:hypothetical protein